MRTLRTVLLVEDEPDIREAMAIALARQGYEVVAAETGDAAMRFVMDDLPDLAVVDMMLPGSSGFQVTRLLKERSNGQVPVIMMSANSSAAHRDYALASGVDTFLSKPCGLPVLVAVADGLCPARPSAPVPALANS